MRQLVPQMLKSINITQKLVHVLWLIIHRIVWTVITVRKQWNRFAKRFRPIRYRETPEDVARLTGQLTKMPTHIAFCVEDSKFDIRHAAQIIRWLKMFKIDYVSLYSHRGHFKNGVTELEYYLSDDQLLKNRTLVNNNYNKSNGTIKRITYFGDMKIQMVDADDSHEAIVRSAKYLIQQDKPFDEDDITAFLQRGFDFPDPEVMMAFGPTPTLYGYPVWQIRLTEIYFLDDHRYFDFQDFCDVLLRYSKCEQRFGK